MSGSGASVLVEMSVCDRGQTLQVCVIWPLERSAGVHGDGREHWAQSSSGLSFKVFKRNQRHDKNRAAGLEVHQKGISNCTSPIQCLKVCGSSLADVKGKRRLSTILLWIPQDLLLMQTLSFVTSLITLILKLLGAVLEIILKGCLQNYTVKTKQAYV